MKTFLRIYLAAGLLAAVGFAHAAQPLVDVEWVKDVAGKPDVVLLDVRSRLSGNSKATYMRAHIPGAVYTDYMKDGWRVKDKNGTPAMLPPADKLEKLIGGLGIDNASHVVIIPQGAKPLDMGTATRIYWTFKVLGHDNVSILDGGMTAYTKEVDKKTKKPVNPLEKGMNKPASKTFKANLRKEMVLTKKDVEAMMGSDAVLIDHRPNDQFVGINRHGKAKRNGTIPGSVNLPESWLTENAGGQFRSMDHLKNLYAVANVPTSGETVSFCNSGHWASMGWFVNHELMGNSQAKMYDGSMIEWTADKSLPIDQKVQF